MKRLAIVVAAGSILLGGARTAAAQDALTMRVTIDYRNAAAADVIGALARAAGVPFEIGAGTLRPVTITLTNVRLTTALDAVCDNASCAWRLDGALKVTPVAAGRRASLPPRVSFDVKDSPGAEVFRAMGAAIGVTVTVSPGTASPEQTLSLSFHNAATTDVLNMMCEALRCEWSFDAENGLRIAPKKR